MLYWIGLGCVVYFLIGALFAGYFAGSGQVNKSNDAAVGITLVLCLFLWPLVLMFVVGYFIFIILYVKDKEDRGEPK